MLTKDEKEKKQSEQQSFKFVHSFPICIVFQLFLFSCFCCVWLRGRSKQLQRKRRACGCPQPWHHRPTCFSNCHCEKFPGENVKTRCLCSLTLKHYTPLHVKAGLISVALLVVCAPQLYTHAGVCILLANTCTSAGVSTNLDSLLLYLVSRNVLALVFKL